MNIKQIKELARLVKENELSALEIVEGDVRIRLERDSAPSEAAGQPKPIVAAAPIATPAEVAEPASRTELDFNQLKTAKSPLVGVFYASPAPDMPPFVQLGSRVSKGDVLCIVEAMKLMNEIVAEVDGEIVDICVQNGDVVEFGQTLFKLH